MNQRGKMIRTLIGLGALLDAWMVANKLQQTLPLITKLVIDGLGGP